MPSFYPPEFVQEMKRIALAKGVTTILWPRPPLYLFAPTGGAERFTHLFRQTWGQIPYLFRRSMIGH